MLAGLNVTRKKKLHSELLHRLWEAVIFFKRIYQLSGKENDTLLPPKEIPAFMRLPKA